MDEIEPEIREIMDREGVGEGLARLFYRVTHGFPMGDVILSEDAPHAELTEAEKEAIWARVYRYLGLKNDQ